MSAFEIGLIGIGVLFVLLLLNMPIGFAMAIVGFGGFAAVVGIPGSLSNLALIPVGMVTEYHFAVIPLFVLMGAIAANSGITKDLYNAAFHWVGQFRGGLAVATVLACGGFAAVTGSALAGSAAMGQIVGPEMRRHHYDPRLGAGTVAAGGTLGVLIPPSMGFILYAILTEQSIGRLFMAGIFPGILEIVFYIVTIFLICRINPAMGPAGPKTSWGLKVTSLKAVGPILILFGLVMGGIYLGWFTPPEAGAIGAFGTLVLAMVLRRISAKGFWDSVLDTAQVTTMVLVLIMGAFIFARFLAVTRMPFMLADIVANVPLPPYAILAIILFFYIIMGCLFDLLSIMVLTIPILFPVATALGFDPIWYGVLMVRVMEVGAITPPIGINTYVIAGIMKVPAGTVFRGIVPFTIADLLHIALLAAIPQISLFLPNLMIGK
jgi:C4-dicarboxylate transporter DctM subunit